MQETSATVGKLAQELAAIAAFEGLSDDGLEWIASQMTELHLEPGDVLTPAGSPADRMIIILEGRIRGEEVGTGSTNPRVYTAEAGRVTGMLPYSRLKTFPLTTRALERSRVAVFPAAKFPDLLLRVPEVGPRLVGVLADRIRDFTTSQQQHEKLAALGKLSAGLAHELNNPAAAARRAAETLRESMNALRAASLKLDRDALSADDRARITELESSWAESKRLESMDSLERSDREEEISGWLGRHDVPEGWSLAPVLVDSGCDLEKLDDLTRRFKGDVLGHVMSRLTASVTISRLLGEIEHATGRMSELVRAIKEYSYMDQVAEKEIDIHQGLDNTLVMLSHRLKTGVSVVREYDRTLPKICAHGSELNQVWTNLIDNAIDATAGAGEIRIRTARELGRLLVEIRDNGSGVPPEIQDRIFEPFFTTKGVGGGIGLGLDVAYRIVQKQRGEIRLKSQPGDTRFQVYLPFASSDGSALPA